MKLILCTLFLWNLKPNEGAVQPSLKKESFCLNIICQDEFCEDGSLAPKNPNGCCPDSNQCQDDNVNNDFDIFNTTQRDCSAIGCLTELCPNGDIPPTPPGRCCPSALLCPRDNCHVVRCKVDRCSDGSVAPVPVGQCCPDAFYCFDNVDQCSEWDCSQPKFCPNGDLAPVPFGECCPNTELCPHKQCDHVTCIPEFCTTGELAPIPLGECCPKSDQCDNSDCSLVRCFVERCQDGTIAPKPLGKCCPSQTMCPENSIENQNDVTVEEFLDDVRMLENNESTEVSDTNFSAKFKDCTAVTCLVKHCQDGRVAPTPPGSCCPNQTFCHSRPDLIEKTDCRKVACFDERCTDGSRAPVPIGKCCPDRKMCLVFSNDIEDWAL